MPATPPLNSYPTHTRTSHPGWYSRLTYLHSYPETFNTWDSVNEVWNDMFQEQFSTASSFKGNYEWPAGYWKTGMHQRIKGAFQIVSEVDAKFDMTVGIANASGTILSADQNNGTSHIFQINGMTCLVNFEWNICGGPLVTADPGRSMWMSVYGFYHYEDSLGDANSNYHHIPFYTASDSYRSIDRVTWPYMLIKPENEASITLLNLTIEELGG
jgi:hypothetical protein